MLALLQRVSTANVAINQQIVAKIEQGLLVLLAVETNDTEAIAARLLQRILNYRIFADANDKMNLSVKDINGGIIIVPQFTLAADTTRGNRPGFSRAAPPEKGEALFTYLLQQASKEYPKVGAGQFGADMQVSLCNDGPVTVMLSVG